MCNRQHYTNLQKLLRHATKSTLRLGAYSLLAPEHNLIRNTLFSELLLLEMLSMPYMVYTLVSGRELPYPEGAILNM